MLVPQIWWHSSVRISGERHSAIGTRVDKGECIPRTLCWQIVGALTLTCSHFMRSWVSKVSCAQSPSMRGFRSPCTKVRAPRSIPRFGEDLNSATKSCRPAQICSHRQARQICWRSSVRILRRLATPPKGTLADKGEVHLKDIVLANRGCTDADSLTFHAKLGFESVVRAVLQYAFPKCLH